MIFSTAHPDAGISAIDAVHRDVMGAIPDLGFWPWHSSDLVSPDARENYTYGPANGHSCGFRDTYIPHIPVRIPNLTRALRWIGRSSRSVASVH